MVITKNGSAVHPCIKEVIFVVGVPRSGCTSQTRPITSRVAELPSLRYGSVGAKTTTTGPLRVTSHYHGETISRRPSKKLNGFHSSNNGQSNGFRPVRPPRRVRFNLPTTDGDGGLAAAAISKSESGTTGDGWLPRSRSSSISQHSDLHSKRSESAAGYCAKTNALDKSKNNFPTENKYNSEVNFDSNNRNFQSQKNNFESFNRLDFDNNNRNKLKSSSAVLDEYFANASYAASVAVTSSPATRTRIHPTGRYIRGTLSPTSNASPHQEAASPGGQQLLRAARDGDDHQLRELLRRAATVGISQTDLNTTDSSGRTILSYVASNGSIDILEQILQLPGLDPNKPDNEGNTPLHFAAQAGQMECLNCMLSRCRGIEIDARNHLGFTPLMKAALQGRNKCAKLLLFAGANPTLRDNGRGFRADQWARFCGRYVCADVIEKHARQRLLERSTSYGNWGGENELGARVLMGKVVPVPTMPQQPSNGLKSKLRKVFRTSSGPHPTTDTYSSARLVTQLTSAALCASSPVLPSAPSVPPVVKSLIRPLTVPRLQITLVNNNGDFLSNNSTNNNNNITANSNGMTKTVGSAVTVKQAVIEDDKPIIKPIRTKKKK